MLLSYLRKTPTCPCCGDFIGGDDRIGVVVAIKECFKNREEIFIGWSRLKNTDPMPFDKANGIGRALWRAYTPGQQITLKMVLGLDKPIDLPIPKDIQNEIVEMAIRAEKFYRPILPPEILQPLH